MVYDLLVSFIGIKYLLMYRVTWNFSKTEADIWMQENDGLYE